MGLSLRTSDVDVVELMSTSQVESGKVCTFPQRSHQYFQRDYLVPPNLDGKSYFFSLVEIARFSTSLHQ